MEKIKFMNKESVSKNILDNLKIIAKNPEIKNIFCGMETHLKKGAESPSSVTIKTTTKYIYPFYSSNSLNCGIGFLSTGVDFKKIENKIPHLFKEIDKETTLSQFQRFFGKKEITTKELKRILVGGIERIPERYGKIPCNFEYGGNLFKDEDFSEKQIISTIPKFLWKGGRIEIGKNAGGNHFIEMQVPIKVYDKTAGIEKDKVYFMVHLGTGYLGGSITGVYCHRKRTFATKKYQMIIGPRFFSFKKWLFLIKRYGLDFVMRNYKLFFNNDKLDRGILFASKIGKDFFIAEYATMNYGYAWRYIVYSKILKVLKKITKKDVKEEILLDKSHNSIFLKDNSIYYNRNSCNMKENDLFTLPGDKKNHSYLCQAKKKMKEFDFNIDHGLGILLKEDNKKIKQKEKIYNFKRRRYTKTTKMKHKVRDLEYSKKTFDFLKKMEKKGYFKIICQLRIVANLK